MRMGMPTEEEIQFEAARRELQRFVDELKELMNLEGVGADQIFEDALYRHHDLAVQLAEDEQKRWSYVLMMIYVPYYELYLRGRISNYISLALDENELREMLKPVLLEIRTFIEDKLKPFQDLPDPVKEFRKREKLRFRFLHDELKEIILQGGRPQQFKKDNVSVESFEEVKFKVETLKGELYLAQQKEQQERGSSIEEALEVIVFPEKVKQPIINALLEHVEPESKEHLIILIDQGRVAVPVKFNNNLRRLGTFFKTVYHQELHLKYEKSIFCKWMVQHFQIKDKDKVYAAIEYLNAYKCMSEKDREAANPIPFLR